MITPSIVRCWMQAASRRSIAVTEPPEAHHIDGQRTGLVTSPPGRPIRRDAACGSFVCLRGGPRRRGLDGWGRQSVQAALLELLAAATRTGIVPADILERVDQGLGSRGRGEAQPAGAPLLIPLERV